MAEKRTFYWIKIRDTFLTSDKVDFLMSQKNGANYVVLYQMLCLKTINNGGVLGKTIGEFIIPYDAEKIQRDCKWFDIDTISVALILFQKLGLIYKQEDGFFKITNFEEMAGSETNWALQKREQRALANKGRQSSGQLGGHCPREIEKDIEIDKKEEIYKEEKDQKRFIKPTIEEVKAYIQEKNYNIDAERFVAFYESKGWKVGNQPMKNWKAACTTWQKQNTNPNQPHLPQWYEDYKNGQNKQEKLTKEQQKEILDAAEGLFGD